MWLDLLGREYEQAVERLESFRSDAYSSQHHQSPRPLILTLIHEYLGHAEFAEDAYAAARLLLSELVREYPED